MVSPYWFSKSSVLVLVIVVTCLALWIVFSLCCWFAAWRKKQRTIKSSPWYDGEIDWGLIEGYVDELRKQAARCGQCTCLILTWRSRLEFLPSARRFSCEYPNEFGIIPFADLNERIDAERWQCYKNRMIAYSKQEPAFMFDLASTMIGKVNTVITEIGSHAMRKHAENTKQEAVTTEPENEVQGETKAAGPVTVAGVIPVAEITEPGDLGLILAQLTQLTRAIQECGLINGKYVRGLSTCLNERLAALEAAVKHDNKQTKALTVKVTEMLEVFDLHLAAAKDE